MIADSAMTNVLGLRSNADVILATPSNEVPP